MDQPFIAMTVLGAAGLAAAVILYFVAKRFAVKEDSRIEEIEKILPGANCGACGRKGCHDFAVECCRTGSLADLTCPGAGTAGMLKISAVLGIAATTEKAKKAYIRCQGTVCNRKISRSVEGIKSCVAAKSLAMPAGYCIFGCLGCGDCVSACAFDAMRWDTSTGMPHIDLDKCVGCGKCAKACPQNIITIRPAESEMPAVEVACSNHDKGAAARKMCSAACIGCGKCQRTCKHGAITVTDNLAVIDPEKCTGCGDCAAGCPTGAIVIHGKKVTIAEA